MSKVKCEVWNGVDIRRYAQVKIDGNYTRIEKNIIKYAKDGFGGLRILSSQDTDLTEKIRCCKPVFWLNLLKRLPDNTTLLGELYYPNKPASYIKSGIANCDGGLRFAGFAIANMFADTSLEEIQCLYLKYGLEFAHFIRLSMPGKDLKITENEIVEIDTDKTWNDIWNIKSLLNVHLDIVQQRKDICGLLEGWVLKNANLEGWAKVKQIKTIDCFIVGWNGGLGKNAGKVGSLSVAVYPTNMATFKDISEFKIIADVSGFDDRIRDWLSANSPDNPSRRNVDDLVEDKQVIEVHYQYVGTQGRLRHPQFKKWRTDKEHIECFADQDLDLKKYYGML